MSTPVTISINGKVDPSMVDSFRQVTGALQSIQHSLRQVNQISKLASLTMGEGMGNFAASVMAGAVAINQLQRALQSAQASFKSYTGAGYGELAAAGLGGAALKEFAKKKLMPMLAGAARLAGWGAVGYYGYQSASEYLKGNTAIEMAEKNIEDLRAANEMLGKKLFEAIPIAVKQGRITTEKGYELVDRLAAVPLAHPLAASSLIRGIKEEANLMNLEDLYEKQAQVEQFMENLQSGNLTLPTPPSERIDDKNLTVRGTPLELAQAGERAQLALLKEIERAEEIGIIKREEYFQMGIKVQNQVAQAHEKVLQAMEEERQRRERELQQSLSAAAGMLGSFASLAQSFGRKGFAAWKALAIAEAIVSTAAGVARALGSASPPLNISLAAMTGAAGAAQIARIASTQPSGYARGGYTGAGAQDEPAGVVHRGEFVLPADAVAQIGLPALEAMRQGHGAGGRLNVAVFDDRSAVKTWMQSQEGQAVILEIVGKNRHRIV